MSTVDDLRAECEALDATVTALDDAAWQRPTIFHGWTIHDEIIHNHHLDLLAMMSLQDPVGFVTLAAEVARGEAADPDYSFHAFTKRSLGILTREAALARWRETYRDMCALFAARDPAERMAWFGPPMSVDGCAAARQMEVWAHGQDIYDLLPRRRANTDSLRNIALLGVKTFGWSFVNRGMAAPPSKPFILLTAPSGAVWAWNDPASAERVSGPAEDFCLVVTQRRHVADTALVTVGEGARAWLRIAQCFAGGPADGPAPGMRVPTYLYQPASCLTL